MKKIPLSIVFTLILVLSAANLPAQDVLRGQVMVEMEPIYGFYVEDKYPLDYDDAYLRALQEAAMFFSASIYGWSFDYEIGERARNIPEVFELEGLGEIPWGDPGLKVTHANFRDMRLWVWMDYHPIENQQHRLRAWRSGHVRTAQAVGYGPMGFPDRLADWLEIKRTALEDAARAAVRAMLQGSERNRPKEARGFIGLQAFPMFWVDSGRWACSARFYVVVNEIVPFAAY
jgi:hypothetical protein